MSFNKTLFIASIALALTAFGCGDDSSTTPDGSTGTPDGSAPDGSAPDGSAPDGSAPDGSMCKMAGDYYEGMDNCNNAEDIAASMREDFGDAMDQSAADLAATCGRGCALSDPTDIAGCTAACVVTMSGDAVSAACSTCYAASVACSAENCLAVCISPTTMDECDACRAGTNDCSLNCTGEFFGCSGLPIPED